MEQRIIEIFKLKMLKYKGSLVTFWGEGLQTSVFGWSLISMYRIIHKSLRDFRLLRYSSRDGHAEGEHVNRGRDAPSFCPTLQVLDMSILLCLSWLLHSRVRKFRRDLWITLCMCACACLCVCVCVYIYIYIYFLICPHDQFYTNSARKLMKILECLSSQSEFRKQFFSWLSSLYLHVQ